MDKLIVIEGACDGIGKTTQYNMLSKRLEEDGPATVCSVKDVIAWSTLPNRLMRKEGSL